ncbi:MAG: NAD(P)H-hydrate epimerase [Candidatus Hadarchaeales archaeon]
MKGLDEGCITSEEMGRVDEESEKFGVPRALLMENAGSSVARFLLRTFGRKGVLLFCGTGNNGGDGLVAARHLASYGCRTEVVMVGDPSKIRTPEARLNWEVVRKMDSVGKRTVLSPRDLEGLGGEDFGVVVDAMLGTGVKGELREPYLSSVRWINRSGLPVVAVDTPTGLDPSTGKICGEAVKATFTLTFHRMKKGLLMAPHLTGTVLVEGIGVPPEAEGKALGRVLPPSPPEPSRLVSACLLGVKCRWDGKAREDEGVKELARRGVLVPVCPEVLGGLGIPRAPMRLTGKPEEVLEGKAKALREDGRDVTGEMVRGAEEVLRIARTLGIMRALLKEGSPSCGREGVTAALLRREGLALEWVE